MGTSLVTLHKGNLTLYASVVSGDVVVMNRPIIGSDIQRFSDYWYQCGLQVLSHCQ